MLDLRQIRQDPATFNKGFASRGLSIKAEDILKLDEEHRSVLTQLQDLQTKRNTLAKQVGEAKRAGQEALALIQEAEAIKLEMANLELIVETLKTDLHSILSAIPNIPADDVPEGLNEASNVLTRTVGDIPKYPFTPKAHFELGEQLGLMDFDRSAKMSGARFVVLYGPLARLERALAQFMLEVHTTEFGYKEVSPPLMVLDSAVFGTGQLPKAREDMFQTNTGHWLIPTSEVVLSNLVAEETIPAQDLPYRFTAHTPCFRSEAGAAGRDTRGMIRQHQFSKVELVSVTTPDQSEAEHERMTKAAESILQKLNLPYRVMALCAGDMGFSAKKTFDMEVWLPSQDTYREISSCSNCGDFQARRMNARYRPLPTEAEPKPGLQFVHTLNGSGLAVGRTLVAVMENYQQEDGSIRIPDVLLPYMGGLKIIQKDTNK